MSDELSRRGTRRSRTQAAALRQVHINANHKAGIGVVAVVDSPHYFAKRHAVNCGNPQCHLCMNPRRNTWLKKSKRLTRQELQASEAARLSG